MKKFLALFLVMIMSLTVVLASCNSNRGIVDNTNDDDEDDGLLGKSTRSTTSYNSESGIINPDSLVWEDKNDIVYVDLCNTLVVRKEPSDSAEKIAWLQFGDQKSYKRIKANSVWSLIEYADGKQGYVGTACLTTDPGSVVFNDEEKTVYAQCKLNLHSFTDATGNYPNNVLATTTVGEELTQTGVSKNGRWIRVSYKKSGSDEPVTMYALKEYDGETFIADSAPSTDTTGKTN